MGWDVRFVIALVVVLFGIIADRKNWGGSAGGVVIDILVTIILLSLLFIKKGRGVKS